MIFSKHKKIVLDIHKNSFIYSQYIYFYIFCKIYFKKKKYLINLPKKNNLKKKQTKYFIIFYNNNNYLTKFQFLI